MLNYKKRNMDKMLLLLGMIFLIHGTNGHLCLVFPEQRGAMDITRSGSSTCFRHGAPCGGQSPETPGVTPYIGGQQMWIKLQQNFNHYEVGFPGYMDVAIAPLNSSDFQMLAFTPDYYVHAQDHQQNFTTIVVLPNIDCAHCVIRARYNPHKPGESTFYQCADIKIKKYDGSSRDSLRSLPPLSQSFDPQYLTVKKKIDALRQINRFGPKLEMPYLIGLSYTPFRNELVDLVNISLTTGYPFSIGEYNLIVIESKISKRSRHNAMPSTVLPDKANYIYDSIGAINSKGNFVGLVHSGGPDDLSDALIEFDLDRQGRDVSIIPLNHSYAPISALMPSGDGSYYTFAIKPGADKGDFVFEIGSLMFHKDPSGYDPYYQYTPVMKSMPENLYINYQWAEYDPVRKQIYVLMGNENSPDQLLARFYIYNLLNQSIYFTEIDVQQYTFMSMHLDRRTGKLYAVSPGLFYQTNTQWFLIEVDPSTGKSQMVLQIANFGYFARDYGGNVFNGISPQGILYHAFKLYDTDADVIAAIDVSAKTMTFSEITNLRSVHNMALVSP